VRYCSVECQRSDWKDHKVTCGMKLLPAKKLNIMFSVLIDEATEHESDGNIARAIKIMKRALLVAEYQYGDRGLGETFRKRKDGIIIKDWPLFDVREMILSSTLTSSMSLHSTSLWRMRLKLGRN
jgi:hypothetical protein